MIRTTTIYCCWILASATAAGQTATLKMRFVLDGAPPPISQVIDESLLVNRKSRGIKNVLVYARFGRDRSSISVPKNENKRRRLTMTNARFDPHILIAHAGDTLEIVARGTNQMNPILHFLANSPRAFSVQPGKPRLVPIPKPELTPIPVDCNKNPLMRAYVVILDHPFAAVSDSDGNLVIDGLPIGRSITFQAFHESGMLDRVRISGIDVRWHRDRFDVEIAAGVNDLGDVLIPAESLIP